MTEARLYALTVNSGTGRHYPAATIANSLESAVDSLRAKISMMGMPVVERVVEYDISRIAEGVLPELRWYSVNIPFRWDQARGDHYPDFSDINKGVPHWSRREG